MRRTACCAATLVLTALACGGTVDPNEPSQGGAPAGRDSVATTDASSGTSIFDVEVKQVPPDEVAFELICREDERGVRRPGLWVEMTPGLPLDGCVNAPIVGEGVNLLAIHPWGGAGAVVEGDAATLVLGDRRADYVWSKVDVAAPWQPVRVEVEALVTADDGRVYAERFIADLTRCPGPAVDPCSVLP